MRNILIICLLFAGLCARVTAQEKSWKFVHLSDTHIGSETGAIDLRRTVKDINADTALQFVIISGDITEFGSDEELKIAKSILDSLNKPWYIIPGNHDMNWSESGGNSFKKVFGSETFAFKQHGYLFIGTNCGPNMRMGPGQVPRENIVWLDSVLKATPKQTPVIYVNHYPQDSSLNNWYEVVDRLKTHNVQLILCGHGHANQLYNFEGIPGIMGRSNLRAKDAVGGYNIVTVSADSVFYNEKSSGHVIKPAWVKERLYQHDYSKKAFYPRPSFVVNSRFNKVKILWQLQDQSDIGAGTTIADNKVIITNTAGYVKAYNVSNGKQIWTFKAGGKIYSSPAIAENAVLVGCSDRYLYCLNLTSGKVKWKAAFEKPLVSSAAIKNGRVFCGGSDGHFKCYDLVSGKVIWDFNQVSGFIETRPLLYNGIVYFGSWGNRLYALNQKKGTLVWEWTSGSANRMFSPASCFPAATANRLFIVAPDRYMTCFDSNTGKVIWRKGDPQIKVRESMGLSADSSLIFVKTMDGDVLGISTTSNTMTVKWKALRNIGYDISPSEVQENGGLVFALSNSGCIYAFDRQSGSLSWIHKFSNCLVNPLSFISNNQLIATSTDGKIISITY